jgi:D-alanyl-D-alanine dipeptidase
MKALIKALLLGSAGTLATPLPSAISQTCPAPLDQALRLVLVTAPSMTAHNATLRIFQRDAVGAEWHQLGSAEPAVIGRHGIGWGYSFRQFKRGNEPQKVEGDWRAPGGVFQIGRRFGFEGSSSANHMVLRAGETICVNDPSSSAYNTIASRKLIGPNVSGEDMGRINSYRRGLLIDYPTDRADRAGSCIFIHIWRGPNQGTAGCVALPEERVRALQEFSEPGAVIAILPESAHDRFAGCLPSTSKPN